MKGRGEKTRRRTKEATVTFAGATRHVDAAKLGEEGAGQRLRRARPPEATKQREVSCCLLSSSSAAAAGFPAAGFAVVVVAAFELTGPRSMMGADAPLCAPTVVTGAFSIERRGRERKRRAGAAEEAEDEESAADDDDDDDDGEGATTAPSLALALLGAFSIEKTVEPLGVAAPGTLQAETALFFVGG